MTTKDSSRDTWLLPRRVEKVHLRGFTSSRPTPQDSQPQSMLAANSDSLWIFPHLEKGKNTEDLTTSIQRDTQLWLTLLPGHGLDDSRQAQWGSLFPPEGLVELLQADTHGTSVPAGFNNQSRPEVHLTVPVRGVDISVLIEVREHKIHPLFVVPFGCQDHFRGVRHLKQQSLNVTVKVKTDSSLS